MADENEILDPSSYNESLPMFSVNTEVELLYGGDDPKKAANIPVGKIRRLDVKENFFTKLPQLNIVLGDQGNYFNNYGFQIGHIFHVKITPIVSNKDLLPKPYVSAKFVIQSIEYTTDMDRNDYVYTFNCVYEAEKFLNNICVWPRVDIDMTNVNRKYTSEELLQLVVPMGGLSFVSELESAPDDSMAWLNASLTYSEFTDKIVKHAWIDDEDMPLLYVDREGTAHYNSINNLCKQASKATYIPSSLYNKKYLDTSNNPNKKPSGYRTYTDIEFHNIGYIQNQGGYGVKSTIYNPFNVLEMNPIEFKPLVAKDPVLLKNTTFNDGCIRYRDFHDNKLRIGNISNKSPGQTDNMRYAMTKMHFKDTHQYYDYAEQHHESIKRAFFQQFVFITVDVPNQPDYDFDPTQKIMLGDRITIRTDNLGYKTSKQSGDFIVTGITHNFYSSSNYTILITAVSDGINGINEMKKQK